MLVPPFIALPLSCLTAGLSSTVTKTTTTSTQTRPYSLQTWIEGGMGRIAPYRTCTIRSHHPSRVFLNQASHAIFPISIYNPLSPPVTIRHQYIQSSSRPRTYINVHNSREGFFVGLVCYVSFHTIDDIFILDYSLSTRSHLHQTGRSKVGLTEVLRVDISCLSLLQLTGPISFATSDQSTFTFTTLNPPFTHHKIADSL
jgi:hypothetical protein